MSEQKQNATKRPDCSDFGPSMSGSRTSLRQWAQVHIGETITSPDPETSETTHENELFFECTFKDISALCLRDCVLNRSFLEPDSLKDVKGTTVTLDCGTFSGLVMNELAFDAFLVLLVQTKGNTAKRQAIVDLIGRERVREILQQFAVLDIG